MHELSRCLAAKELWFASAYIKAEGELWDAQKHYEESLIAVAKLGKGEVLSSLRVFESKSERKRATVRERRIMRK